MLSGMVELSRPQQHALADLLASAPSAPELRALGRCFTDAGHELYLVGGTVRDTLLNQPSVDVDCTTDAWPEQTQEILRAWGPDAVWLQGARFGTIGAARNGVKVEVTTFRADAYQPDSRKPEVRFSRRIEDDLVRRDFTVNAMAVRLPDGHFVDLFGGLEDLAARRLRTPSSPAVSFDDDPLRMLRAARFVAQLGCTIDDATESALTKRVERLEIVSAERVRDEFSKLLLAADPVAGLQVCLRTGMAERFLPELPALALAQDPVHRHKDVLHHSLAVLTRAANIEPGPPDLVLRLAALLHDIGKPRTRRIGEHGVTFHMHELVGARMVERRLRALRYPNQVVRDVTELVRLHMRFYGYDGEWTDSAVRRYVHDAGPLLDRLNLLVRSDCTTRNPARARRLAARVDDLETRIAQLAEEEERARLARPAIDGHRVMELLGVPPGPLVGRIMRHLAELRLEHGPMGEAETLLALERWVRDEGIALPEPDSSPDGPAVR